MLRVSRTPIQGYHLIFTLSCNITFWSIKSLPLTHPDTVTYLIFRGKMAAMVEEAGAAASWVPGAGREKKTEKLETLLLDCHHHCLHSPLQKKPAILLCTAVHAHNCRFGEAEAAAQGPKPIWVTK